MANVSRLVQMDDGAEKALRDLTSALAVADKQVLKAFRDRAYLEIEAPLAARLQAVTRGATKYPGSASTIKARRGRRTAIWLGAGSGLDATRALGNEFGGQKRVRSVITLSRTRRSRYVVRKRTTMQFWPHRGTQGYAMIPEMRREGPRTAQKAIDIVMDELLKLPGATEARF